MNQSILHSETLPRDLVEQVLETAAHEDVMVYMMSKRDRLWPTQARWRIPAITIWASTRR
ncbi:MAG: hypothetical protein ACLTBV_27740 [Enterocloster bolteae]